MTQMFVPYLGFEFELAEDWTFNLHPERRNVSIVKKLYPNFVPHANYNWRLKEHDLPNSFWQTTEVQELTNARREEFDNHPTNLAYQVAQDRLFDEENNRNSLLRFGTKSRWEKEKEIKEELGWDELWEKCRDDIGQIYVDHINDGVHPTIEHTFPVGTQLIVDRIYIRKGSEDYDSITFRVKNGPGAKGRFWAKLSEVNNIKFA